MRAAATESDHVPRAICSRSPAAAIAATETAVVASVMFAVHPIHTEAVSGLVGRAEMLCGVFYLLALIVYRNATMVPCSDALARSLFLKPSGHCRP